MKKRKVTTKNYRYKIKQFVREYNPNAKNLDFLVTDSKNIVHYLTTNNLHRDTIVGFYSPIVKLIYNMNKQMDTIFLLMYQILIRLVIITKKCLIVYLNILKVCSKKF